MLTGRFTVIFVCQRQSRARSAVIYNHGGLGNKIGGSPQETCEALAKEGLVGFSPIGRQTRSLEGHLDDVFVC